MSLRILESTVDISVAERVLVLTSLKPEEKRTIIDFLASEESLHIEAVDLREAAVHINGNGNEEKSRGEKSSAPSAFVCTVKFPSHLVASLSSMSYVERSEKTPQLQHSRHMNSRNVDECHQDFLLDDARDADTAPFPSDNSNENKYRRRTESEFVDSESEQRESNSRQTSESNERRRTQQEDDVFLEQFLLEEMEWQEGCSAIERKSQSSESSQQQQKQKQKQSAHVDGVVGHRVEGQSMGISCCPNDTIKTIPNRSARTLRWVLHQIDAFYSYRTRSLGVDSTHLPLSPRVRENIGSEDDRSRGGGCGLFAIAVYEFFSTHYGRDQRLRNMCQDFIESIRQFSAQDVDVAMFREFLLRGPDLSEEAILENRYAERQFLSWRTAMQPFLTTPNSERMSSTSTSSSASASATNETQRHTKTGAAWHVRVNDVPRIVRRCLHLHEAFRCTSPSEPPSSSSTLHAKRNASTSVLSDVDMTDLELRGVKSPRDGEGKTTTTTATTMTNSMVMVGTLNRARAAYKEWFETCCKKGNGMEKSTQLRTVGERVVMGVGNHSTAASAVSSKELSDAEAWLSRVGQKKLVRSGHVLRLLHESFTAELLHPTTTTRRAAKTTPAAKVMAAQPPHPSDPPVTHKTSDGNESEEENSARSSHWRSESPVAKDPQPRDTSSSSSSSNVPHPHSRRMEPHATIAREAPRQLPVSEAQQRIKTVKMALERRKATTSPVARNTTTNSMEVKAVEASNSISSILDRMILRAESTCRSDAGRGMGVGGTLVGSATNQSSPVHSLEPKLQSVPPSSSSLTTPPPPPVSPPPVAVSASSPGTRREKEENEYEDTRIHETRPTESRDCDFDEEVKAFDLRLQRMMAAIRQSSLSVRTGESETSFM